MTKRPFAIGPLKVSPKPPTTFDPEWNMLKSTITAIFRNEPNPGLEMSYQAVRTICIYKKEPWLYKRIRREFKAHIYAAIKALVRKSSDIVMFLSLVDHCWRQFYDQLSLICSVVIYLDKTYVRNTQNIRSVWEMGLHIFQKHLSKSIRSTILTAILALVEKERLGEAVDKLLLSRILKMFTSLGIDLKIFQNVFLEQSAEFYASEGVNYMNLLDVSNYLKHVENRVNEEQARFISYFDSTTKKPLLGILGKQLLEHQIPIILEKGVTLLLDGIHIEDLQRMYMLCSQLNCLESLSTGLTNYVRATSKHMDHYKERDNHKNCAAKLILMFVNEKLCTVDKINSREELEGMLNRVMFFIKSIQVIDVFEAFYRKDLAKRLVSGKSECIDAAKFMTSKLKIECGSGFTTRLEQMLQDIDTSREMSKVFRQSFLARTKLPMGVEMSVHVLKVLSWPLGPPMHVKLPREVTICQDIFEEFYKSKHPHRQLTWHNSLGHCVLSAKFRNEKKELVMSLYQAIVLMLFNNADMLSFREIKDDTAIKEKELQGILESLACGKVCVLRKDREQKEICDDDNFSFNKDLKFPDYRIKVDAIQVKKTVEEKTSTIESVLQHRGLRIDAAIVRIMKTSKVLNHPQLMNELSQQLKFPFKSLEIKKRIENLIERDYMQRNESIGNSYIYLP